MWRSRKKNTRKPDTRWPMNAHCPDFPRYTVFAFRGLIVPPPSAAASLSPATPCLWSCAPPLRSAARSTLSPRSVPPLAPHGGGHDVQAEEQDEQRDRPKGDAEQHLRP